MNIFDSLDRDHETVQRLMQQLQQTGDGAEKTREKLFQQVKQDLEAHTMFEDEVFYPAVAKQGSKGEKLIDEAVTEHDEATAMIEELAEMEKTSSEFMEGVKKLEKALLHHIEEERSEVFPLGREVIDDKQAEEMARQYEAAKKDMSKRKSA